MFISVLDLFKIGIGPSSSHTLGPMVAAKAFIDKIKSCHLSSSGNQNFYLRCTLKGSLAHTGKGHSTDCAIALGLHNHSPKDLASKDVGALLKQIWVCDHIYLNETQSITFNPNENILFDKGTALPEHPNGMIFELTGETENVLLSETYFSIGGGFIYTQSEINEIKAPLKMEPSASCIYPFDSANSMLKMASDTKKSIAEMKKINELQHLSEASLSQGMDEIWEAMKSCMEKGLATDGILPGGLNIVRRAKNLHRQIQLRPNESNINDWLCAYAMSVNEENAAGSMVVTAPTNGAAGVIPAVLYYFISHEGGTKKQVQEFLLTASAIGGLIKHRSSISGAEVGCQGEVGSASAMAAAGLCAIQGGTPLQVENAAEIALEHHLGMTCDPVKGLVQVPCIERNGFGAIKAYTAASLAMRGDGNHFMSLDNCVAAMKQTGMEMSHKFKETSLGGLALTITEC